MLLSKCNLVHMHMFIIERQLSNAYMFAYVLVGPHGHSYVYMPHTQDSPKGSLYCSVGHIYVEGSSALRPSR